MKRRVRRLLGADLCECGHLRDEHRFGRGGCYVLGCLCPEFRLKVSERRRDR